MNTYFLKRNYGIALLGVLFLIFLFIVPTIMNVYAQTTPFTRTLRVGDIGEDVRRLQQFLNSRPETQINMVGQVGGPGSETTFFGSLTQNAVMRFQQLYASDILLPAGLTEATGIFGPRSIAKAHMLLGNTTPPPSDGGTSSSFTRTLRLGFVGEDVRRLQQLLNSRTETRVNVSGQPGGPGSETTFFGSLTQNAVMRFQQLYASDILTPLGLSQGTGVFGTRSITKANIILAQGGGIPGGGTGGGTLPTQLTITPETQPASTIVPQGATRVPFTRFRLSVVGNTALTINGVNIQMTGVADPAVFESIVLIDNNGNILGNPQRLNSNRQAIIGGTFTMQANESRTFTIAGNMNSNLSQFQGQIAGISIIGVQTNGIVTGTFPIQGTLQQVNSTLQTGSATIQIGTTGTGSTNTQIGTQNFRFASLRITAGGNEDIRLHAIRWDQSGSASATDLNNVNAVVDGTSYSATNDGRAYTTTFGTSGILIPRGQTKEVTLQGNILSGSGRTITFDIINKSDIYLTGETFGFGITPSITGAVSAPAPRSTSVFTNGTPFFSNALVTVEGGNLLVSRATSIPAQNIGIGIANQTLGGFQINIEGEPVSVQSMKFDIAISRTSGSNAVVNDITNVTIVQADTNTIIAGPVDAQGSSITGTITFSNSFTIPIGSKSYIVKGRLGNTFMRGDTIMLSLVPSTHITSARGQNSGNTITGTPSSIVTGNVVTVQNAALSLSVSPSPAPQTVVAGAQQFTFADLTFDSTASSEDVRLNSLPIKFTHSGSADTLTNCQVYQGTNALTTGSNALSPSSSHVSGNDILFTFNNSITIPKSSITTLSIRCNISSSAANGTTYSFGLSTAPVVTGVTSGQSITTNVSTSNGQTMTVATGGALTTSKDFSSPSYYLAAAGSSNNVVGALRFHAGAEAVNIRQVGLQLTSPTTSNAAGVFSSITLWDGSTQVGSVVFTSGSQTATAFLTNDLIVPANSDKVLTIRANFAQIGISQPGTEGALVKIDYNGGNNTATQGIGVSSGSLITSTTVTDTQMDGVRVFKSIPNITQDALTTTSLINGTQTLLRFRITAHTNGSIGVDKLTLQISESGAVDIQDVNISAFTDPNYSVPASGTNTNGELSNVDIDPSSGIVEVYARNSSGTLNPLQIPAGVTMYFQVMGNASGAVSGSSVNTVLLGDSTYPSLTNALGTAAQVDADTNDNIIWSPNANGVSAVTDTDWTNGFSISGLSSTGLNQIMSR